MPKHHIMKCVHVEVSPACCVLVHFFNHVLMCAGLPCIGRPAHAHSAVPAPSATLLRYCCALRSALCFRDYTTLFKMAPIKCSFCVNEGQLSLLNFPKEHRTKVDNIPISCGFILCGFIYFLNLSS